jgi:hypothetical protein
MKNIKIIVFFLGAIWLQGCVMSKDVFNLAGDKSMGAEKGKGDFVELMNGKIIEGTISDLNLYNRYFFTKGTLEINGKKYTYDEIRALQEKGEYYRKGTSKNFLLPRIKAGKINLYRRYMQNSGTDSRGRPYMNDFYFHYLQKGNKGEMVDFSVKALEEMVSDNQAALSFINEYKEHKKQKNRNTYLDKAIDAYNSK